MIGPWRRMRMWRRRDLRRAYDVAVVGGGSHGLAIAYYLARNHGIRRVAVFEKSYLGSGASGRNTAIVRSNYRTAEGTAFYQRSLQLYERLSQDLDYNILFSRQGHLTVAHTDASLNGLRVRAEVNQVLGVESAIIGPDEIKRMVPELDLRAGRRFPILGALYHPPGGIVRHDAVVWGYARAADRLGAEIFPYTPVTGILRRNGRVTGLETVAGRVEAPVVVNATAGWASTVARMAGVRLPIVTHPLQALVTERLDPFLHKVIVSGTLHVYVNQTDRGELVIGAEIDPYPSYSHRSTLPTLRQMAHYTVELMPCLRRVKVLRQWTGICDMTPDFAPILGPVPELEGFLVDVGWGTYGFKAAPVAGEQMAQLIASGEVPELIRPFSLERFYRGEALGEKAAAATSH